MMTRKPPKNPVWAHIQTLAQDYYPHKDKDNADPDKKATKQALWAALIPLDDTSPLYEIALIKAKRIKKQSNMLANEGVSDLAHGAVSQALIKQRSSANNVDKKRRFMQDFPDLEPTKNNIANARILTQIGLATAFANGYDDSKANIETWLSSLIDFALKDNLYLENRPGKKKTSKSSNDTEQFEAEEDTLNIENDPAEEETDALSAAQTAKEERENDVEVDTLDNYDLVLTQQAIEQFAQMRWTEQQTELIESVKSQLNHAETIVLDAWLQDACFTSGNTINDTAILNTLPSLSRGQYRTIKASITAKFTAAGAADLLGGFSSDEGFSTGRLAAKPHGD